MALSKLVVEPLHASIVSGRRIRQIVKCLLEMLPTQPQLRILDVGCGSGELLSHLKQLRADVECSGVDILVRAHTIIPVMEFDGMTLPFEDNSFDCVILIDVLHHTDHQETLLKECVRVASLCVLIKDHLCESKLDNLTLKGMDWVGNKSHDVNLPYRYLSNNQWEKLFDTVGVAVKQRQVQLNLYPQPFSAVFDRKLHFIARLERQNHE